MEKPQLPRMSTSTETNRQCCLNMYFVRKLKLIWAITVIYNHVHSELLTSYMNTTGTACEMMTAHVQTVTMCFEVLQVLQYTSCVPEESLSWF